MPGCGCAGSSCSCKIEVGDGLRVNGLGTLTDPIRIELDAIGLSDTVLQFQDSASVDFTVIGAGVPGDPLIVTAVTKPRANGILLPQFTTAGRPAPGTAGVGAMIWNTSTNKPNFSDGTAWRDAAGTVV